MTAAACRYPAPDPTPHVSALTWVSVFVRPLAIQGSWNYETLLGNGIGFCARAGAAAAARRPARRRRIEAALARESQYFNAHPYLASVAVGALARAELDGEPPARIERFRTALCGPLGSVGDRLVWAGMASRSRRSLALVGFGLGARRVAGRR